MENQETPKPWFDELNKILVNLPHIQRSVSEDETIREVIIVTDKKIWRLGNEA